jgi:4-amino-4-deoxy-L-arabinose transferase-like glycosyltransferase
MGEYNNPNENNNNPNNSDPNQPQNNQPQNNQDPYQNNQNPYQNNQNPYQNNQNPYQNNQYQNNQYQQYQPINQPQSNGMAIASLIMGILGVILGCCLWYFTIPLAIAGLVLGIIVIKKKKGGRNLAIVGIILCSLSIILGIFSAIMVIAVYMNPEFSSLYEEMLQDIQTTY